MRVSPILAAAMLAAATVPAGASTASGTPSNYTFPDGITGFALKGSLPSSSGAPVINPGLLVGFNPQPDPPGTPPTLLSLTDPTNPVLNSGARTHDYQFIISFVNFEPPDPCLTAIPRPNADGFSSLSCSAIPGGADITATLQFSGPGGVSNWVSFNPQPDPPGDVSGYGVTFGGFDASVRLSVTVNGVPVSFTPAPEPGTLGLLGAGLVALGARRWRNNG